MIYLASPYSDPSSAVRYNRFASARDYTYSQMQRGEVIFSPIAYGHQFAQVYRTPADHEWWKRFNESVMLACQELRILKLDGWDKSKGVSSELQFAAGLGLEITYAEWRK